MAHTDTGKEATDTQLLCCPDCDLVSRLPTHYAGHWFHCPRCHHAIARDAQTDQATPALAMTALVFLGLALAFPYIRFETAGLRQSMSLLDAAGMLASYHHWALAILVLLTIVVIPALYLISLCWIHMALMWRPLPGAVILTRWLPRLQPWMMADVFAIAGIISLVKIVGMADVALLWSFWAYLGFALTLLVTIHRMNTVTLWRWLLGARSNKTSAVTGVTARQQGLVHCTRCGHLQPLTASSHCQRCHAAVSSRLPNSLQTVLALSLTAVVFAFPAHLYPIMITTSLGSTEPATIMAGVFLFISHGDWPIAAVIFFASVVVPFAKIIALLWLCVACYRHDPLDMVSQMRLYRVTEWIGRWSMVDVFVVAITVALVQLGNVLTIAPGMGGVAFAAVVIFTMLAAHYFDPRLIWDRQQAIRNDAQHVPDNAV